MISGTRLERLFRELDGSQTHFGAITVKRALALIETAKRYGGWFYRVEVGFFPVHKLHYQSWTTIYVDITGEGIQLRTQRCTSCPGCPGCSSDELDARPVTLQGDEEWKLFKAHGPVIAVSEDVLRLLKAHNDFPSRQYPLAASEARTLAFLPSHLRELFETVREVAKILLETKVQFKSGRLATARSHLTWALEKVELSIGE